MYILHSSKKKICWFDPVPKKKLVASFGSYGIHLHPKMASTSKKLVTKYYAVLKGRQTGIFTSWAECQQSVTSFKGALFQSFFTEEAASRYLSSTSHFLKVKPVVEISPVIPMFDINKPPRKGKRKESPSSFELTPPQAKKLKQVENFQFLYEEAVKRKDIIVFTDGSCMSQSAGIGVYFGRNDSRNLSEKLPGTKQTNIRAELYAIVRALQSVPADANLTIFTDSQFSLDGISGKNVINTNHDLFKDIDLLLKQRQPGSYHLLWIPAHSKVEGNEMADILAKAGTTKTAKM